MGQGLQDSVKMTRQNPARAEIIAEGFVGQIAFASEQFCSPSCGVIETAIFQAMEWIVMNKAAHGPVIANYFARQPDQPSQLHPLGFAVRRHCYLVHEFVISMALRY